MKKYLLFSVIFMSSLIVQSQTKLIAFKSHSGSITKFQTALMNSTFDLVNHNLGMGPQPIIRSAAIDSVIFLSDTSAIMVTSQHCKKSPWYYNEDPKAELDKSTIWSEGTDTVYNHPLFSEQHSLDSIRTVLKKDYYFQNDIDCTVFIGFDNGDFQDLDKDGQNDRDQNASPLVDYPSNNTPGIGLLILFTALLAVFIGLISWRFSRIKNELIERSF